MQPARITIKNKRGRHAGGGAETADLVLVAGQKGRGRNLFTVHYWPWSPQSVDKAYGILHERAATLGYEIVS